MNSAPSASPRLNPSPQTWPLILSHGIVGRLNPGHHKLGSARPSSRTSRQEASASADRNSVSRLGTCRGGRSISKSNKRSGAWFPLTSSMLPRFDARVSSAFTLPSITAAGPFRSSYRDMLGEGRSAIGDELSVRLWIGDVQHLEPWERESRQRNDSFHRQLIRQPIRCWRQLRSGRAKAFRTIRRAEAHVLTRWPSRKAKGPEAKASSLSCFSLTIAYSAAPSTALVCATVQSAAPTLNRANLRTVMFSPSLPTFCAISSLMLTA